MEKKTMTRIFADLRMVAIVAFLAASLLMCSQAYADTWTTGEEPPNSGLPADGTPTASGTRPCEIFSMSVSSTDVLGKFRFNIDTNFGDKASRVDYGTSEYLDTYTSGLTLANMVAGDLYIRRYDGNAPTDAPDIYGLVLETRVAASDSWNAQVTNAGYSYNDKTAGELYEWDDDETTGFATGTWEGYEAWA
ncbi:MAG: hypothetical protein HQ592_11635, partial [Planctomycetes bacterium]|nr:hypothetical protein [Planctomycetota bacterium]